MEQYFEQLPQSFVWSWLVVFVIVILVLLRFGPKVWEWFKIIHEEMKKKESIDAKIKRHDEQIEEINQKLDRDYLAINSLKKTNKEQTKKINDSVEEREIIMESLLGIIKGLQELGTNGPTKDAQARIENYMLKKSHEVKEGE